MWNATGAASDVVATLINKCLTLKARTRFADQESGRELRQKRCLWARLADWLGKD
jgi:hypothetical protein